MPSRLDSLVDDALQFLWRNAPMHATAAGVHDHDHRLADFDATALAARVSGFYRLRDAADRLRQGSPALTPDEALDAGVLRDSMETEGRMLEEVRLPFRDPSVYLEEILYGVYYLVQRDFAPLEQRVRAITGRLSEVPRLLRQAGANLGRPEEIPAPWVDAALKQLGGSLAFLREMNGELVPGAGAAGRDLRTTLSTAVEALEDFGRLLTERLVTRARGDYGIGRSMFDFLLRRQHGLETDADDLHAFGVEQVAHTQEQLAAAVRGLDAKRSWRELVTVWKADHPERSGFAEAYRKEVSRARAFVREHAIASIPDDERLLVTETPSFHRSICPFAAYLAPGPFESMSEGVFWVTPPGEDDPPENQARHLQDHPLAGIPGTTVHESYPGHHLQLSVAHGIASRVRRYFSTAVMVEGWAFYCEQMMGEAGFYTDPRSRVLQLKDQLWRSCRVVIDVGLHTRGMSLEEASGMLHEVACLERSSAAGECLRYCRTPTQPMSYAVGKREILRLREDYRRLRGGAFTLREFHDRLLSFGSIPVARIRERLLEAAASR